MAKAGAVGLEGQRAEGGDKQKRPDDGPLLASFRW